jgi:hypothetical protein
MTMLTMGTTVTPTARPEVTSRRIATASSTPATSSTTADPLAMLRKQQLAALLGVNCWTLDRWRRTDEATLPERSGSAPRPHAGAEARSSSGWQHASVADCLRTGKRIPSPRTKTESGGHAQREAAMLSRTPPE